MAEYNKNMVEIVREEYSVFSPTDITLFVAGEEIGSANGLRYQITRDKQPNYTFGHVMPKAYSRGIREITGELTELVVHGHDVRNACQKFMEENYIFRPYYDDLRKNLAENNGGIWEKEIIEGVDRAKVTGILYLDELYPFDITCVGVDEFGNVAKIELFGCEFVTKNAGISMEGTTALQDRITFICRSSRPMYQVVRQPEESAEQMFNRYE